VINKCVDKMHGPFEGRGLPRFVLETINDGGDGDLDVCEDPTPQTQIPGRGQPHFVHGWEDFSKGEEFWRTQLHKLQSRGMGCHIMHMVGKISKILW
jgi:hypothetical protein